jgi:NAD(P)-dependent dehydrogenase (short-subunit alcohol dehydrogenase family)
MAVGEGYLVGRSVVITGAGSGVGRAAAELFAQHGARLVCADVQEAWLEETVGKVRAAGGEALAVRCDVRSRAELAAAVEAAVKAYGRLDVMYNNAGVSSPLRPTGGVASFLENTEEDIERLYGINVRGVILGCQVAIAQFRAQGGGGVIVNTASAAGLIGWGGTLYASTKGAVVNLTRALAMEVGKEDIRVNSVCPGTMVTKFGIGAAGDLPQAALDAMAKMQPLGRIVDAEDAAAAALYLASDLAHNITGVNLAVDGGVTAGRSN